MILGLLFVYAFDEREERGMRKEEKKGKLLENWKVSPASSSSFHPWKSSFGTTLSSLAESSRNFGW